MKIAVNKSAMQLDEFRKFVNANKLKFDSKEVGWSQTVKAKQKIEFILQSLNVEYVTEHQFAPPRKFRFDWAIPELKVGIEYEGIFSNKSRHTSVTGYTGDANKYNLAILNGWRVLRYTAMNVQNLLEDMKTLIINKS